MRKIVLHHHIKIKVKDDNGRWSYYLSAAKRSLNAVPSLTTASPIREMMGSVGLLKDVISNAEQAIRELTSAAQSKRE